MFSVFFFFFLVKSLTLLYLADVTINDMRHHKSCFEEIIPAYCFHHLTGMIHPYSFRGKYLSLTRLSIIMEPSTDTSKSGHVRLRIMFCMRKADLFDPASYSE